MASPSPDASYEKLLRTEDDEPHVIYVRAQRSRWSLFRSWFGSFALGVVFASGIFAIAIQVQKRNPIPAAIDASTDAHAHAHAVTKHTYTFAETDALPTVPWETVVFESDPLYSERPSDDTDVAWNQLLPPGRGYVYVEDSAARGLPRGERVRHGEIYSVAMYHQLHCLARLRKMHWVFKDAVVTGEDAIARSFAGRKGADHIQHCFDYLRQAIICNGDMTLEWPKLDGASSGAKVDGWGIPHQCKSKVAIDQYMDKYHFNESISIDAAG